MWWEDRGAGRQLGVDDPAHRSDNVANKFSKGDLAGKYSWTAIKGDDPRVSGEPDRTLFNRHEGYEVLYLLNKFAGAYAHDIDDFLRAERMLQHLPSTVRSQARVIDWLETNWPNGKFK